MKREKNKPTEVDAKAAAIAALKLTEDDVFAYRITDDGRVRILTQGGTLHEWRPE